MSNKKLFGYAIIDQGKKAEKDIPAQPAKVLVPPTYILADNEKEVVILAGRQIPEEYLSKMEQIDIAVRPF
jgi:hypothetical protein